MKKSISGFIFFLAIALMNSATGQEGGDNPPASRSRNSSELNKESSSFVADPDPLDPLPVKNENLKEDAEPVLEDIRQVIDAPPTKKKEAAQVEETPPPPIPPPEINADPNTSSEASAAQPAEAVPPAVQAETPSPAPVQDAAPKRKNRKKKKAARAANPPMVLEPVNQTQAEPAAAIVQKPAREDDEPDLKIENRFHSTFKKYNAEPTDESGWQKVVLGAGARAYTVQPGDTLWSISGTLFGDSNFWPKLWAENRRGIENPHFLIPGMQVVFAAGTLEDAPALALQQQSDGSAVAGKEAAKDVPTNPNLTDSTLDEGTMEEIPASSRPGQIPASLPGYKNPYLSGRRDEVKIELQDPPVIDDVVVNDIFFADSELNTEVEISRDEDSKGRCGGSHILYTEDLKSTTGGLKILEPLERIKTEAGRIHTYKIVGEAQVLSNKKVKVTNCKSVSVRNLVFISEGNLPALRSNKISKQESPIIIGGPNAGNQILFTDHQIAYVDVGSQQIEMGQILKVRSKLTEEVSGEIKVIDKFGSFAIGVVSDVVDLIETGDSVLVQQQ